MGLSGIPDSAKSPFVVRILVLDDHKGVRSALELMLEWEGHQVASFEGGDEALAFLQHYPVDFILMDWNTPGVCGEEFIAAVERICLPLFRPPIGVLSGDSKAELAVEDWGARFFLMKPYAPADVIRGLNRGTISGRFRPSLSKGCGVIGRAG